MAMNARSPLIMIRAVCLCLLLSEMSLASITGQVNGDASDEIDFNSIDEYIASKMRAPRIPGLALAIVKDDRIVYLKGYGEADPTGRPVTPQTPFLIGSITKSFTALAVMQLVEAGKIELDAPVQRYMPWFRVADTEASAQITVRHLLNQTSGIPSDPTIASWTWPDDDQAMERHVRLLSSVELTAPPGKTFAYSNVNYVILGVLVKEVSGESYEDYVRHHIFAPLEMKNSYVSQDEAMQHGMAIGHTWWFGFPVATTLPYNRSNLPAGFAICSAEDMAHYVIAQMNDGRYRDTSILSPDGIALMHSQPAPSTYGLGWETVQLDGHTLINHDGATGNFQASVFFDPEARVGVFVAANVMNAIDAFSSPPGSSAVDGVSTRAMAESILSLTTKRPLPDQGPGIGLLTIIFDAILFLFTAVLTIMLARIPRRYRRLRQRGIPDRAVFLRRIATIALLHFVWPLLILYIALEMIGWKVQMMMLQPDLGYWLETVAAIIFVKGMIELALAWQVFGLTSVKNSWNESSEI
jgi:CubicO group peptidase (beta-lactamase class C family)